jgi:hypothetical protein
MSSFQTPQTPPAKRGRGSRKHLPLRDERGELVVCVEIASHWPEPQRQLFARTARTLFLRWFATPPDTAPSKNGLERAAVAV